jgi:OOP family OmpA-OmpF porin
MRSSLRCEIQDAQLESAGHTCSIGTDEYNQQLSGRRAASVKAYLVKKGVAADRIVSIGYGETKPMADNKTRAGRELNRRVEVCTVLKVEKKVRVIQ